LDWLQNFGFKRFLDQFVLGEVVEAVHPVEPVQPVGIVVGGGRIVALEVDERNAELETVHRPISAICQKHVYILGYYELSY
jgi:hypothetical protein